jgi:hypothetical protein
MNNRYLAPYFAPRASKGLTALLCITILALAPACCKHQPYSAKATKGTSKDVNVNTMIEVDNDIFEIEEEIEIKKSISKF